MYADKIRKRYREASKRSLKQDVQTANGAPKLSPLSPAQYGKIVDDRTGRVGNYALADDVADRDIAEAMNEEVKTAAQRWYTVRMILAWGKLDGRHVGIKKAGIYLLSPVGLTHDQSEQLLVLPGQEYVEALEDIRKRVDTVRDELQFVLEHPDPHPYSCPNVDRHRLVSEALKMWTEYPIYTHGNIEIRWPDGRVKIVSTRDQLLTSAGQTQLFEHVSSILDLMGKGYRYDPKTHTEVDLSRGSLRRYGPDEKWPGAVYRGGPLNED